MVILGIEMWVLKTLLIERTSDVPSQVDLQRVSANPVAMYQGEKKPRRKRLPQSRLARTVLAGSRHGR